MEREGAKDRQHHGLAGEQPALCALVHGSTWFRQLRYRGTVRRPSSSTSSRRTRCLYRSLYQIATAARTRPPTPHRRGSRPPIQSRTVVLVSVALLLVLLCVRLALLLPGIVRLPGTALL